MIINLTSQTDLSGFYLIYKGSTNYEKEGYRGVSHLSEHLLCKGIDSLQDKFQSLDIYWNAYTSCNEIVFYITGLDEQISEWRNTFFEKITSYVPTKEEFEHEKSIVLEELEDSFNDQVESHMLNLDRKLYGYYNAIGSKEDLQSLTYENYLLFHNKIYDKLYRIINVSKYNEYTNDSIIFNEQYPLTNYTVDNTNTDYYFPNSFNSKTSIVWRSKLFPAKDYPKLDLLCKLYCDGLNAPMYHEVREKQGLVYHMFAYASIFNEQAVVTIGGLTSNKKVDAFNKAIIDILNNPDIITEERFNIVKQYLSIRSKRNDINRYSSVDHLVNDYEDTEDYIKSVTYNDIQKMLSENYLGDFMISTDKDF